MKQTNKQKALILSVFIFIGLFSVLSGNAQERRDSLICDETNWRHTKSGFSIITSNDNVFEQLKGKFEGEIRNYVVRYLFDRHGKGKSYTIFFYPEREKEITDFLAD